MFGEADLGVGSAGVVGSMGALDWGTELRGAPVGGVGLLLVGGVPLVGVLALGVGLLGALVGGAELIGVPLGGPELVGTLGVVGPP
ncbi:hypothetical protein ACSVDM_21490 [Nocardia sp. JW2]|uniref:hypothetical protein n=1 Tax=Nocardia sp. JW2 TaxID=3450738 RepID=UPI003F4408F1